jgi:hypothetical protein
MSTETLTQSIGAGATVNFGAGSQFLIVSSSGPISIKAVTLGSSNKNRVFTNVPAGFKFTADTPDDGFDLLQVTSATAQSVTMSVGTDDVTYSNSVTVQGTVATAELPAGALSDAAPVPCLNAQLTPVVPQNLSRRRLLLTIDPTSAAAPGTLFFRVAAGANNLTPAQPGMSYPFNGTYAVSLRNDSGASVNVYIQEES